MTPQQTAKVEALVDAIEDVAFECGDPQSKQALQARQRLARTLGDFLAPTFRVMNGAPPQEQQEGTQVRCVACDKDTPCAPACKFWAKATRRSLEREDDSA